MKSGFVTIVGRPNVGKSTLLNCIIGQKIAIMSDKPQTTRNTIRAIYNDDDSQIVFLDTPGIHKPKHALGEFMVRSARRTFNEVDAVLFMTDDAQQIGPGDQYILEMLQGVDTPVYVVINKVDLMSPDDFKAMYDRYKTFGYIDDVIGISAIAAGNVDGLIQLIKGQLEEGPQYFPEDMITDQPERQLVAEIIREKTLLYLDEEVPHGIAVVIDRFKERTDKPIIDIQATIICEKKSHKGIILGKQGRKIKGIGKASREEIEALLGSRVFLETWVKVKERWRDSQAQIQNYGYKLED